MDVLIVQDVTREDFDGAVATYEVPCVGERIPLEAIDPVEPVRATDSPDAEFLRNCAWDIGERKPAESFVPTENHVGLAMVSPYRGFAHWRLLTDWIDRTAGRCGDGWNHSRVVLRLYDVSYIEFNGLNAHCVQVHTLDSICGQMFFHMGASGTRQLAEVGFLLQSGEFIPAARSQVVAFPPDAVAGEF